MVGPGCNWRQKLSTTRQRTAAWTHNRSMNGSEARAAATPPGRFLTIADVAEILNISASQAYSLVRSGELPAIKVGAAGYWRVERTVLESYIDAKYEESRRHGLWTQSQFSDIPELSFGLR